jgi:methyl-CpG-binding domain protein 4
MERLGKSFPHAHGLSCVEIINALAQQQMLRHLCSNQCYLRAFAPQRDWWALRKALHRLETNESIDDLLHDWTCCLAVRNKEESANLDSDEEKEARTKVTRSQQLAGCSTLDSDAPTIRKRHQSRRNPACTEFLLKTTGQRFVSVSAVMRYLSHPKSTTSDGDEETSLQDGGLVESQKPSSPQLVFTESKFMQGIITPDQFDGCAMTDASSSPFGLAEELFSKNPWQLLICTIFLNRTQRKMIDATLHQFLQRWPDPQSVLDYSTTDNTLQEMNEMVACLGMTNKRARGIVQFCKDFVLLVETRPLLSLTREEISQMYYCGDYAADVYQIFILGDVHSSVRSNDHALLAYVEYKLSMLGEN